MWLFIFVKCWTFWRSHCIALHTINQSPSHELLLLVDDFIRFIYLLLYSHLFQWRNMLKELMIDRFFFSLFCLSLSLCFTPRNAVPLRNDTNKTKQTKTKQNKPKKKTVRKPIKMLEFVINSITCANESKWFSMRSLAWIELKCNSFLWWKI